MYIKNYYYKSHQSTNKKNSKIKKTTIFYENTFSENIIDSYDDVCIHNFANDIDPGFTFPNNGKSQEDCLLRKFPELFHSLNTNKKSLYPINSNEGHVICTDYVTKWRDKNNKLIDKSKRRKAMFVSAGAPDHKDYLFDETLILQHIRNIILAPLIFCIDNKIKRPKTLVLGSWGCGEFYPTDYYYTSKIKPDISDNFKCKYYFELIATLIHHVLIKEKLFRYYENIVICVPNIYIFESFKNIIS
jgi:hypothetical protein